MSFIFILKNRKFIKNDYVCKLAPYGKHPYQR